jgi:hypothetical protein
MLDGVADRDRAVGLDRKLNGNSNQRLGRYPEPQIGTVLNTMG